jgi:hypothetical protein
VWPGARASSSAGQDVEQCGEGSRCGGQDPITEGEMVGSHRTAWLSFALPLVSAGGFYALLASFPACGPPRYLFATGIPGEVLVVPFLVIPAVAASRLRGTGNGKGRCSLSARQFCS